MVAVIAIAAVLILLAICLVPGWVTRGKQLTENERLTIENDIRKTVAEVVGGLAVIGGFVFTWQTVAATWGALELRRQEQTDERFTNAVGQLKEPSEAVQVGAVYGLARVAATSEPHRTMVAEVLTTFVHTGTQRRPKGLAVSGAVRQALRYLTRRRAEPWHVDLQAIHLDVGWPFEGAYVAGRDDDLDAVGPKGSESTWLGMSLEKAVLVEADFTDATLGLHLPAPEVDRRTRLVGEWLSSVHGATHDIDAAEARRYVFRSATLNGACVAGANFTRAHVEGVDFTDADLSAAYFTNAHVDGATFYGANLSGAQMASTGVSQEQVSAACSDKTTRLPKGIVAHECSRIWLQCPEERAAGK